VYAWLTIAALETFDVTDVNNKALFAFDSYHLYYYDLLNLGVQAEGRYSYGDYGYKQEFADDWVTPVV